MIPSERMILTQGRRHIRATWIGLFIVTAAVCGIIFAIPRPIVGTMLYLSIGLIVLSTIGAGTAAYSLTRLVLLDMVYFKRREEDVRERLEREQEDGTEPDEEPSVTTAEEDVVLWDDPSTEETETEEIVVDTGPQYETFTLPPVPLFHKGFMAVACTLAFFLQLTLIYWYIEDAAISFAYAKHFAAGEGLVTYPGGERVEGYSNPLWTLLLSVGYMFNISGFVTAKVMGLVFSIACVPMVYEITRHLRPHRQDATPMIAALLLAGNAQFAIWGAAGLENSLFNFLLAWGIWRVLVEAREPQLPYSSLAFFGLAITRPEGILYAAIGGFWFAVCTAHLMFQRAKSDEKTPNTHYLMQFGGYVFAWLALFFGPFFAYHYARYNYFGWEFPNTYYAKKGHRVFEPFGWTKRGWRYLRNYSHDLWQGYLLPIYLLAMTGIFTAQRVVWWALTATMAAILWVPLPDALGRIVVAESLLRITAATGLLMGITLMWATLNIRHGKQRPSFEFILCAVGTAGAILMCTLWWGKFVDPPVLGVWRAPSWWIETRVWGLLGIGIIALGTALTRPGWRGLCLCFSMAMCSIFFSLYATGDWMKGYRWMASLTVTCAPLMAIGLAQLGDWADHITQGRFLQRMGVVFWSTVAVTSLANGVLFGIPAVSEYFDISQRLWPIDTVSVMVLLPMAIATGLLLGRKAPINLQWRSTGFACVVGGLAIVMMPQFHHLDWFTQRPETGPFSVRKRVLYNQYLARRLHLDHVTMLDVDMGATMYWSGFDIVDIAGLVDTSMGHHWMEKPFMREYIFEERKPDFAHVHGAWARTSKIPQHPEWRRDYIEVPGYPTSKKSLHLGNHIRRDLLMTPEWSGAERRTVVFDNGVQLVGWTTAGDQLAPGRAFYLEVALRTPHTKKSNDFRLYGFLAGPGGELKTFEIPPGYDWYPPHKWGIQDTFVGRYSIDVPVEFRSGRYDLGFVLIDANGVVVPPKTQSQVDPSATPDVFRPSTTIIGNSDYARVAVGEIRFPRVLQMASEVDLLQMAGNDVEEAVQIAKSNQCEQAETLWQQARRRLTRDTEWEEKVHPTIRPELTLCWIRKAKQTEDLAAQVPMWAKARYWDRNNPTLLSERKAITGYWISEGIRARDADDWERAYRAFKHALDITPTQSFTRRWAEEARDQRLSLNQPKGSPQKTSVTPSSSFSRPLTNPSVIRGPRAPEGGDVPEGPEDEE